jgi:hypothetical protein
LKSEDTGVTTLTLRPGETQVIKFNVDRHYDTEEARRKYELWLGRPIEAFWTNYDGNADTLPDGAACQYGAHEIKKVANGYEIVWGKYVFTMGEGGSSSAAQSPTGTCSLSGKVTGEREVSTVVNIGPGGGEKSTFVFEHMVLEDARPRSKDTLPKQVAVGVDQRGSYTFRNVPAGQYTLFPGEGFASNSKPRYREVTCRSGQIPNLNFELHGVVGEG